VAVVGGSCWLPVGVDAGQLNTLVYVTAASEHALRRLSFAGLNIAPL
jgi:hypothetical protein